MLSFLAALTIIHFVLIVIGFPLFVAWYLIKGHRTRMLGSKTSLAKFGSLYEELNYHRGAALAYHLLFLMRRLLLICQAVFLGRDHQFLNIAMLMATSTTLLVYIARVRPFEEPYINNLELFNETTILFVSAYHCIVFSDVAQASTNPALY